MTVEPLSNGWPADGGRANGELAVERAPPRPDDPTGSPDGKHRERPTPAGDGLDPTRYGDWEKDGRCIDF